MSKREKKLEHTQKGAQEHAEGQHGSKTHQHFLQNLQQKLEPVDDNVIARDTKGKHRLFEDREQHDEADKNSEKTRLGLELERAGDEAAIQAHPALKGGYGRNRRGT